MLYNRQIECLVNKIERMSPDSEYYPISINFLASMIKEKSLKKQLEVRIKKLILLYNSRFLSNRTGLEIDKCYSFLKREYDSTNTLDIFR